jgi:4'-phosphopantetheinyl transferase EntD
MDDNGPMGIATVSTTQFGNPLWIGSISLLTSDLGAAGLEPYKLGHSHERAMQLACADRMVSAMLGRPTRVERSPEGAPFLPDSNLSITISHTGDFMGIAISPHPHVAIDIELQDRNIERMASRFTSDEERDLFHEHAISNPLIYIWGVKECLFKAAPVTHVLFKDHFKLLQVTQRGDSLISSCMVQHPKLNAAFSVVSRIFGALVVSYIDQPAYGHANI